MKKIIIFFSLTLMVSCASSIATTVSVVQKPLESTEEVAFFDLNQSYPAVYQNIGIVKIRDNGFTINCDFETVIALAKAEARKMGGNAIRLINHDVPSVFGSSCHQIQAQVLKIEAIAMQNFKNEITTETAENQTTASKTVAANTPVPPVITPIPKPKQIEEKVTINVNYGPAFRIGQLAPNLNQTTQKHLTALKSGSSFDISAYYNIRQNAAVGIKYNNYNSKVTTNNFPITYSDGTPGAVPINSDHNITFVGVGYSVDNKSVNDKFEASLEMALGYLGLEQLDTILGQTATTTGSTFGLTVGLGYKYRISKSVAIGPQLNMIGGVIKELKVAYPNGSIKTIKFQNNEGENLWRFDINFGISFRL